MAYSRQWGFDNGSGVAARPMQWRSRRARNPVTECRDRRSKKEPRLSHRLNAASQLRATISRLSVGSKAKPVSIYRIFRSTAFEPEAVINMSAAYEDALRVLKLADRADPITELVARKIIEVARTRQSNRTRLRDKAFAELNKARQSSC